MSTQAVISIVKDKKVLFKCVAGCNGMEAAKTVKAIKNIPESELTLESIYKACLKTNFGCKECLVVQSQVSYLCSDMDDGLSKLYNEKFSDPKFNPRWKLGIASYVKIIKI
jgi:hypothetical protein